MKQPDQRQNVPIVHFRVTAATIEDTRALDVGR
jgi:hypothetical protein